VLAGLLFGGTLVAAVALNLHARPVKVPPRVFAAILAAAVLFIAPLHIWSGWAVSAGRYDAAPQPTEITEAHWLDGGWRNLPSSRILLEGDLGEPILAQTTWPAGNLILSLGANGWAPIQGDLGASLASSILPSRTTLTDHAPWPLTHLGRPPLATLTRAASSDRRFVLRIWASDALVQEADTATPLLLISVTTDALDPFAFGFSQLMDVPLPAADQVAVRAQIAASLSLRDSGSPDAPLLAAHPASSG